MKRLKQEEDSEKSKLFKKTDLVTAEGLTMPINQIDHLNLENSNKMKIKINKQNETTSKLVQAEKKTNNSKSQRKTVYTKYKKGQRQS